MKRINLFFLSLLACLLVGTNAWGAAGDVITNITDGTYLIYCPAVSNGVYYDGSDLRRESNQYFEINPRAQFVFTKGAGDFANFYTIKTYDGKYVTYSSTTGNSITFSANNTATDANKWWSIRASNADGSEIDIIPKQNNITTNTAGWNFSKTITGVGANKAVGFYNASDGNSKWILMPSVESSSAPEGDSFAADTKWYTMTLTADKYFLSNITETKSGTSTPHMPLTDKVTNYSNKYLFCFVGDHDNGYKIYNKEAGTSKLLSSGSNPQDDGKSGGKTYVTMVDATTAESQVHLWDLSKGNFTSGFYLGQHNTNSGKNRLNSRNEESLGHQALAYWTGGAGNGSTLVMQRVYIYKVEAVNADGETIANGGVSFDNNNYTNGQDVKSTTELSSSSFTAISVDGYKSIITIENNKVKVTYFSKIVLTFYHSERGSEQRAITWETENSLWARALTSTSDIPTSQKWVVKDIGNSQFALRCLKTGRYMNAVKAIEGQGGENRWNTTLTPGDDDTSNPNRTTKLYLGQNNGKYTISYSNENGNYSAHQAGGAYIASWEAGSSASQWNIVIGEAPAAEYDVEITSPSGHQGGIIAKGTTMGDNKLYNTGEAFFFTSENAPEITQEHPASEFFEAVEIGGFAGTVTWEDSKLKVNYTSSQTTYTVKIVDAPQGQTPTVTITGLSGSFGHGDTFEAGEILSENVTPTSYTNYTSTVVISGTDVIVTYKYTWPTPTFGDLKFNVTTTKANTVTPAVAGDDSKWYLITQKRGSETVVQDRGSEKVVARVGSTPTSLKAANIADHQKYLVRFIPIDANIPNWYKIQFATGAYLKNDLKTTTDASQAEKFLFYNINGENTHFGWNVSSDGTTYSDRIDNNGDGTGDSEHTLSKWGTGEVTQLNQNNDWSIYSTSLTEYDTYTVVVTGDYAEAKVSCTNASLLNESEQGNDGKFYVIKDATVAQSDFEAVIPSTGYTADITLEGKTVTLEVTSTSVTYNITVSGFGSLNTPTATYDGSNVPLELNSETGNYEGTQTLDGDFFLSKFRVKQFTDRLATVTHNGTDVTVNYNVMPFKMKTNDVTKVPTYAFTTATATDGYRWYNYDSSNNNVRRVQSENLTSDQMMWIFSVSEVGNGSQAFTISPSVENTKCLSYNEVTSAADKVSVQDDGATDYTQIWSLYKNTGTAGGYAFQPYNDDGTVATGYYLNCNGGSGSVASFYIKGPQDDPGSRLTIHQVESRDVTAAGWATSCLSFNAAIAGAVNGTTDVTSDAKAYYLTLNDSKKYLNKTEVTDIASIRDGVSGAYNGFLLKGVAGSLITVYFKSVDGVSAAEADANMLLGTLNTSGIPISAQTEYYYYILSYEKGGAQQHLGFYWQTADGKSVTIPYQKSVLRLAISDVTDAQGNPLIKGFSLDDDEPTAISDVDANIDANEIYNLDGQRVNKLQKGINIVNGQKVYVK